MKFTKHYNHQPEAPEYVWTFGRWEGTVWRHWHGTSWQASVRTPVAIPESAKGKTRREAVLNTVRAGLAGIATRHPSL